MATKNKSASSYLEKLTDPRWQRKRLEMFERSDWACELCGAKDKTLHVHHNQYLKGHEPWDYECEQLTVLCKDCHQSEHAGPNDLGRVISFVSIDGVASRHACANLLRGFIELDPVDSRNPIDWTNYMLGMLSRKLSGWGEEYLNPSEVQQLALMDQGKLIKLVRELLEKGAQ